uniref:Uncharacterized protein n=1 Tax=Glossina austeni TaxID=7395 RepID=A0A1A9UP46_GLOAU
MDRHSFCFSFLVFPFFVFPFYVSFTATQWTPSYNLLRPSRAIWFAVHIKVLIKSIGGDIRGFPLNLDLMYLACRNTYIKGKKKKKYKRFVYGYLKEEVPINETTNP